VGRLEQRVVIANLCTGRHAHTADQASRKIGQDISKHVFHDQDVEISRPADQVQGLGINVIISLLYIRKIAGTFIGDFSE
jgi:hypothetical protein